jgi:hypothetical protein
MKYDYLTFNFTNTEAFGHFYLQATLTLDRFIYFFLIMGVCQQGSVAILWTDVGGSNRSMAKML